MDIITQKEYIWTKLLDFVMLAQQNKCMFYSITQYLLNLKILVIITFKINCQLTNKRTYWNQQNILCKPLSYLNLRIEARKWFFSLYPLTVYNDDRSFVNLQGRESIDFLTQFTTLLRLYTLTASFKNQALSFVDSLG